MALTANILESLQSDLRIISNESKRKLPPLKEASESVITKLRALNDPKTKTPDIRYALYENSLEIIEPFLMGCEFRQNQKVVQISLNAIQRMITCQAIRVVAASRLVDYLWNLMENNLEEVKVLQTATLLLSTNSVVSGPVLARTIVLCFRLYRSKNVIVNNIASATIRQLVSNIFERVENEDAINFQKEQQHLLTDNHHIAIEALDYHHTSFFKKSPLDYDELKSFISGHLANLANAHKMQYAPKSLGTSAADAFLLLRDLILLLNDEQPLWLVGLTDINKEFILEILELAFVSFSDVLARHDEFKFLIKERVCSMILCFFSPDILICQNDIKSDPLEEEFQDDEHVDKMNLRLKSVSLSQDFISVVSDMVAAADSNKPMSSSSMRILRILSMLVQKFYQELVISSSIFTSIFVKLLKSDTSLKQVSGPLKLARLSSADTGTAGTTISSVATSDIPVVTTMISKLFEKSHLLKQKHLRIIVIRLSKLSLEFVEERVSSQRTNSSTHLDDQSVISQSGSPCSDTPTRIGSREPSPYVLAKLLELGLVNLHRISCIWDLLTDHFFQINKHPNVKVRDWGSCALTHLIKQAFCYSRDTKQVANSIEEQDSFLDYKTLLKPLQKLSQIDHPDIRQKQLDVVLQVIQSTCDSFLSGDTKENLDDDELKEDRSIDEQFVSGSGYFTKKRPVNVNSVDGWPQIIDIIGTINDSQTDNLIRIAFQCLQAILNDNLAQMNCDCILLLIASIVRFANQMQDLNISLTAIGQLWNVTDYLYQNKQNLEQDIERTGAKIPAENLDYKDIAPNLASIFDFVKQTDLRPYDLIWLALFAKLGEVCIDSRPAVRKSACQSLFATITTHGSILDLKTWQAVVWEILFPLLHQVKSFCGVAPDLRLQNQLPSMFSESFADDESLNSGCDQLVLHHSRNTAQKQWSETQVLALTGVTKVFTSKQDILTNISNFNKAWLVLLEFIKSAALSKVFEVSSAAFRCLQDLVGSDEILKRLNEDLNETTNDDFSLWLSIWVVPIIDLIPLYDESISVELREDFARCCYEALLQLSNYDNNLKILNAQNNNQSYDDVNQDRFFLANFNDPDSVNKLAVDYLLKRFAEIIIKYNHDERLAGKCPLPRNRMSEISFVLKAITKLLKSLKKTATSKASSKVWDQMLSLYAHLVEFATRNSPAEHVRQDSLHEVLLEFGGLLCAPLESNQNRLASAGSKLMMAHNDNVVNNDHSSDCVKSEELEIAVGGGIMEV